MKLQFKLIQTGQAKMFIAAAAFAATGICGAGYAGEIPRPVDTCQGDSQCTPYMLSVLERFNELKSAPQTALMPAVYSGECQFLEFGPDPAIMQHAVTLLENEGGKATFGALLSFFAGTNPYANLTVEQARKTLADGGSHPTPLNLGDDFAEVEYLTEHTGIWYWLRQDPQTHEVILISDEHDQGFVERPRAYCRLTPNAKAF